MGIEKAPNSRAAAVCLMMMLLPVLKDVDVGGRQQTDRAAVAVELLACSANIFIHIIVFLAN